MQASNTSFGLVLLVWAAGLGAAMQFSKFSFLFGELGRIYPDAGASLGFLVSILSVMGIFLGLFSGVLVSRFGFKRVLINGLVIGALMSMLQAFFPPFWIMLLTRLIEGLSQIAIVVAAPTLIGLISAQRHHGLTMSLWGTFFGVAYAITNLVAPAIIAAAGPSGLLVAHGALLGVMAILLALFLPGQDRGDPAARLPALGDLPAFHIEIYRSPFLSAPALGWVGYTLTYVSLLTLLPEQINQADRLFVVTAMPLVSIVVSLTLGVFLLRFMSAAHLTIAAFAVSAACALLVVLKPDWSFAYLALFSAMGLVQGASYAAIPQLNPSADGQARANGALAQMGNLGNSLGTPLLLAIFGATGFGGMMGTVVFIYLASMITHIVLERQRAEWTAK